MSLQDVRVKTQTCLTDIYSALDGQGAEIPEQKNLVNVAPAIESISAEAPVLPQVHNYLMLYDGTLGEAGTDGANVCSDVTGGWELNPFIGSGYTSGTANLEDNRIYLETIYNGMKMSTFGTKNKVNIEGYKKACSIAFCEYAYLGERAWTGFFLGDVKQYTSTTNQSESAWVGFPQNSEVRFRTCDLTTLTKKDFYFQGYISASGTGGSAKCSIYGIFMVKQDNYQPILDLAGITTIYTDEDTICADETVINTILNNEEAIKYMIYNCTGTFMLAFIQSETALKCLNKSPYKTLLYGNEVWLKFLSMIA